VALEVTLGTGMLMRCISYVTRGEGEGSDGEDMFDDRQHVPEMQRQAS
jgi:hypothetical protein